MRSGTFGWENVEAVWVAFNSATVRAAIAETVSYLWHATGADHWKDLEQDVFLELIETVPKLAHAQRPIDYLRATGRNHTIDYRRHEVRRAVKDEIEETAHWSLLTPLESHFAHHQWLRHMTLPQRRVFYWLATGEGIPPYERRHLRRLTEQLAASYEESVGEPLPLRTRAMSRRSAA